MNNYSFLTRSTFSLLVLLVCISATAFATVHIVQFGGPFGFTYSPSSMSVNVGDTIDWQGDFSFHPLSSTSVPVGALAFSNSIGLELVYQVLVAGTYQYHCDAHFTFGMTGSFVASSISGVDHSTSVQPGMFRLDQNFPNPFNPTTTISFVLPIQSHVTLSIYNLIGAKVATIIEENMPAGIYSRTWNAASFPSGVYFYQLRAGNFTQTKKLDLLK